MVKVGDVVRFLDGRGMHAESPKHYPGKGAVGTVVEMLGFGHLCLVRWENGSTSEDDTWCVHISDLELVGNTGKEDKNG